MCELTVGTAHGFLEIIFETTRTSRTQVATQHLVKWNVECTCRWADVIGSCRRRRRYYFPEEHHYHGDDDHGGRFAFLGEKNIQNTFYTYDNYTLYIMSKVPGNAFFDSYHI